MRTDTNTLISCYSQGRLRIYFCFIRNNSNIKYIHCEKSYSILSEKGIAERIQQDHYHRRNDIRTNALYEDDVFAYEPYQFPWNDPATGQSQSAKWIIETSRARERLLQIFVQLFEASLIAHPLLLVNFLERSAMLPASFLVIFS